MVSVCSRCSSVPRIAAAERSSNASQLDHLALELDAVARDPREIEQIVDQPDQMLDLLAHELDQLGAVPGCPSIASMSMPLRIGASGLRSSCESTARNSSLRRSESRSSW